MQGIFLLILFMLLLYTLGLRLYRFLILLASPFNSKARLFIEGRKGLFSKLKHQLGNVSGDIIWIHCASLGEFEQGRPIIEAIKRKEPSKRILLTFFSPSGYEIRKNYPLADIVSYLPIDTPKNASKFLSIVHPKAVFFIKYEWWYHITKEIKHLDIPLYSVSCIFRESQPFFKKSNSLQRKILAHFTHFFVQNKDSKDLLSSIGFSNCTITGDTRFDRVAEICAQKKELPIIKVFSGNATTFIIGSSWPEDIDVIAEVVNRYTELKVIIAPHELGEGNFKHIEQKFTSQSVRYSKCSEVDISKANLMIIDNMGMLSSIYQYADIAYIGGAFGKGLHNTLEAATFGLPILFGPKYNRFQEAKDLLKLKGAFSIKDKDSFSLIFDKLINDSSFRTETGNHSRKYVLENTGATDEILNSTLWKEE